MSSLTLVYPAKAFRGKGMPFQGHPCGPN